jgi:type I restriction enzyme S subunit
MKDNLQEEKFQRYPLGEIGDTISGLTGKSKDDFGKGLPFVPYMNVYSNTFINLSQLSLVDIKLGERQSELKAGDILFTTSSETPDEVGMSSVLLDEPNQSLYLNSFCFGFRLKNKSIIDSKFAGYLFRGKDFRKAMRICAKGTTRFNLSKSDFLKTVISIPPIESQKRIATILESVDKLLAATQSDIDQAEKLKKALMHQLFTKGIGHTKFKQTEIGEIPENWTVTLLDNVTKRGTGHTPNKKNPNYYNGGIKWVSLTDSNKLDNGVITKTSKQISHEGIKNSSAVLHKAGTVILSRDAGVGKSAILGDAMAVSQHFVTWTCGDQLNNWFLYYYLQYKKAVFENIASGSTIKTIGMPFFKQMKIIVPKKQEQERIAEILQSIDKQIEVNKRLKAKQEQLKQGLMQDLLARKVLS